MKAGRLLSIVFLLTLIFSSCKKEKMKRCVVGSTRATIQGNGSVYMEALADQDNSIDCEYGFCYATNDGPLVTGNSITAIRDGYTLSALFPPAFNGSARYYFRPWGTVSGNDFYGTTITLDSIVGNPKGSGCPLRPNMLDLDGNIYAYASVYAPQPGSYYLYIQAQINTTTCVNLFLPGNVLKEGVYKTVNDSLKAGEAQLSYSKQWPVVLTITDFIDKNNSVVVKRLSEGVFEIVVCEATFKSTSMSPSKLSTRFIVHT